MAKELRESVRDARLREAERLLQQERLGLDAVVTIFLQLTPDPERAMERLDQMAETAVEQNLSARTRDAIIFGQQLFRRRLERHLLKQLELLPLDEAEKLADNVGEQGSLLEPHTIHGAQASAEQETRDRVLAVFRNKGVLSDVDLYRAFQMAYRGSASRAQIEQARVSLRRQGILARSGDGWDLVERTRQPTGEAT